MRRPQLLVVLATVLFAAAFAIIVAGRPDPALLRHPRVVEGLDRLGVATPDWKTVVIVTSRDVSLPRAQLVATWSRLEDWPRWGTPLIAAARWLGEPGWRVGNRFEQTLDLGFPLTHVTRAETIGAINPGGGASWWTTSTAVAVHQTWSFETLADGGTRVTLTQLCQGVAVGFLRQVIEHIWQRRFDQALDGMILASRRTPS